MGEGPEGDERAKGVRVLDQQRAPLSGDFQVTLQLAEGADTAAAMREFHLSPEPLRELPLLQD